MMGFLMGLGKLGRLLGFRMGELGRICGLAGGVMGGLGGLVGYGFWYCNCFIF